MVNNQLDRIRLEIDDLDRELSKLLEKRMDLVSQVADFKKETQTNILDESREQKVLENALSVVLNSDYVDSITATFKSIMNHSREYQKNRIVNSQMDSKRYILIGEHLTHSLSVPIHNFFFKKINIKATYDLLEVPKSELTELLIKLRREGYSGVNVTIPYKTEIMRLLDVLSEEVIRVGAVNTIKLGEKLIGYNTDYHGFGMALAYNGVVPEGKLCAVLGSGGSSRAVVSFLEDYKASSIAIVTRDPDATSLKYPGLQCIDIKEFSAHGFDLVVNTTPVGMTPKAGFSPIKQAQLQGASFVMDLIYNPAETLLLQYARELDIPCANGLYMLVAQGICAQEIWQDTPFDQDMVNAIYEEMKIL